jgi:hypothetical protein
MDNDKKISILKNGIFSPYWEEFVRGLPWDKESAETKLYVAGVLCGFSHDFVLGKMVEQSQLHGDNFRNMGFFVWTEFFSDLLIKNGNMGVLLASLNLNNSQQPASTQININGDVVDSTIIIGNENKTQNSKKNED